MAVPAVVVVQTCCLPPQSLEECPLDEEEDGFQALGEEDEDIDQFNDDTFGAGAVGELLVPISPSLPTRCLVLSAATLTPLFLCR